MGTAGDTGHDGGGGPAPDPRTGRPSDTAAAGGRHRGRRQLQVANPRVTLAIVVTALASAALLPVPWPDGEHSVVAGPPPSAAPAAPAPSAAPAAPAPSAGPAAPAPESSGSSPPLAASADASAGGPAPSVGTAPPPPPEAPPRPPAATGGAPGLAPPTAPGARLANGGFEAGALSPWTCTGNLGRVVAAPVNSGGHALAGAPSDSDRAQCSQVVAVQPGRGYTLSGWVRGAYAFIGVSGAVGGDQRTFTPGAGSYTRLSVPFTTGPTTTSVTVWVHGWYEQGPYYADDVTVN